MTTDAHDHGRSSMVREWNFSETDFENWKRSPAGVAALAKLRAFFDREATFHRPPEFETRTTPAGTPFRLLKTREVAR